MYGGAKKTKKNKNKKQSEDKTIRAIEEKVLIDISNLFEQEKEGYYKPIRVGNFYNNNYIKYKSNGDRNKTLSIEEYINKMRQHLKYIINNLKKSDIWKFN